MPLSRAIRKAKRRQHPPALPLAWRKPGRTAVGNVVNGNRRAPRAQYLRPRRGVGDQPIHVLLPHNTLRAHRVFRYQQRHAASEHGLKKPKHVPTPEQPVFMLQVQEPRLRERRHRCRDPGAAAFQPGAPHTRRFRIGCPSSEPTRCPTVPTRPRLRGSHDQHTSDSSEERFDRVGKRGHGSAPSFEYDQIPPIVRDNERRAALKQERQAHPPTCAAARAGLGAAPAASLQRRHQQHRYSKRAAKAVASSFQSFSARQWNYCGLLRTGQSSSATRWRRVGGGNRPTLEDRR